MDIKQDISANGSNGESKPKEKTAKSK
jgi:hypothetical protein